MYAIANVAMHDALNAIVPRFERYADSGPIEPDAGIAAAVLTAAHDAIVGADPGSQAATDAWYGAAIAEHSGTPGYALGVALGHRVAATILAARASDGTAGGGVAPYSPGSNPGDYRFTFPFNTPGFDFFGTGGFADASTWGSHAGLQRSQGARMRRLRLPLGHANRDRALLGGELSDRLEPHRAHRRGAAQSRRMGRGSAPRASTDGRVRFVCDKS